MIGNFYKHIPGALYCLMITEEISLDLFSNEIVVDFYIEKGSFPKGLWRQL
jgi:hypothetical protein